MKKVLLVAALAAGVMGVQAQDNTGISFGVKAGANFYNLSGDDAEGFDMKIGVNGGAFVNIPVGATFAIQPELIYSAEGAKMEEGGIEYKLALGYLNVPIMLKYQTTSGFYGELGPQIGFLMSAKEKVEGDGIDEEQDVKESFKSTAFGLGIGLGYTMPSGFGFGARYNLGLANIIDAEDVDVKSSGFQIGLHYRFGGSK